MRKVILIFIVLMLLTMGWAWAQTVKVLVLTGNVHDVIFPVISNFTSVNGDTVEYTKTNDRGLPDLESYDILWIAQGEICENAYFFNKEIEDKIKSFVENGGIVISIGQDSDGGRPCESGWLPVSLLGVERGGTETFEPTKVDEVDGLFDTPNKVERAHFDDAWTQAPKDFIVLATINNGQDLGIGLLPYGRGFYIVTSLENESASEVATNTPIVENLIHYAVGYLLPMTLAVDVNEKLPVLWGGIKGRLMK